MKNDDMSKAYLDKAFLIDQMIDIKIIFEEHMYRERESTEGFMALVELEEDRLNCADYVFDNNEQGIDMLAEKYLSDWENCCG